MLRESVSILRRTDGKPPLKYPAQVLLIAVTRVRGNAFERQLRLLQRTAGRLEAHGLHHPAGRASVLRDVRARESTRRHAAMVGEPVDREVSGQVRSNPRMQLREIAH